MGANSEGVEGRSYMYYNGEYKHYKDGGKSQKSKKCSFWSHIVSILVKKELERLIDYTEINVVTNKLSFLATNGCIIVAGADQAQGAWCTWVKNSSMSGAESKIRWLLRLISMPPILCAKKTAMKFFR